MRREIRGLSAGEGAVISSLSAATRCGRYSRWIVHLGAGELVIILLIVLLFFGPSRLPQLASSLGAAVRGFKRAAEGGDEPKVLPTQNGATSQQNQNPPPQV